MENVVVREFELGSCVSLKYDCVERSELGVLQFVEQTDMITHWAWRRYDSNASHEPVA